MVFSNIDFLFFFLPLLLLFYFLTPKKFRNNTLLVFSLLFYYFGEKNYIILLLISCFINYILGLLIAKYKNKSFLIIGIIFNLAILFYYKYMGFFLNTFTSLFHLNTLSLKVILPLGISFFTFQNLSYLIDVYKNEIKAEKNLFTYCTYITLFPQLVAGPIIRYKDIKEELVNREESIKKFSEGITRFIIGLSKKVLIADTLYNVYSSFTITNPSTLYYWLVALIFTFQIYYDFSGYSDMAIGLGKMLGFNFPENFNYPLISSSITEFWRRWHISLSAFFKDYVYIPLGGNRCNLLKNIRNILIVWLLTGLWHGANWNFIIWGLYFFAFLVLEKIILKKYLKKGFFSHLYTFIIIIISFVIFNITNINELIIFLKGMIGIKNNFINYETIYFLKNNCVIILLSFIGISPLLKEKLTKGKVNKKIMTTNIFLLFIIFLLSIARIISSSFSPFIYFRF